MRTRRIEEVEVERYKTAGDYFLEDTEIVIQVVKQKNDIHTFLIGLHEYFEQFATELDDISEEVIMRHDLAHPEADEPGELDDSPYRSRHRQAEILERMAAEFLGVDWKEYENEIIVSR